MDKTIRCVAIDDEPLALEVIRRFCQRMGGIELTTFTNPAEGLDFIEKEKPALVFLDIEMDNIDGLKIAAGLPEGTCFIFTTAYLRYALDGFDLDAVDYLHKPFAYSRFQTAVEKAMRRIGHTRMKTTTQCIVVKQDYNNISIPLDDILYIEAMEGYSRIFRAIGQSVTSRVILKNICAMLPESDFLRIHRSFIVSRSKIRSFSKQEVFLSDSTSLPIGRQYAAEVIQKLVK